MALFPVLSTAVVASVSATVAAAASALVDDAPYLFTCSTNCWLRQGTAKLVTCATKANTADTDYITITANGTAVVYEFDTAGDGVTAGRIQVDVSAATTAADVAAILKTAIEANQTTLRVVDPADGTLKIDLPESRSLTITENVAHASFTVAAGIMQASAATGSMFIPAGAEILLDGSSGAQVGIIRDSVDGKSSIARVGSQAV